MTKFEYEIYKKKVNNSLFGSGIEEEKLETMINQFGISGCELVNCTNNATGGGTIEIVLFFKRPLT